MKRLRIIADIIGTILYFVVVIVIFPLGLYIIYDYWKNHRGKQLNGSENDDCA